MKTNPNKKMVKKAKKRIKLPQSKQMFFRKQIAELRSSGFPQSIEGANDLEQYLNINFC